MAVVGQLSYSRSGAWGAAAGLGEGAGIGAAVGAGVGAGAGAMIELGVGGVVGVGPAETGVDGGVGAIDAFTTPLI